MSLTRTTADAVLKDFYLDGVRKTLNNEVFLLSQIEQNSEDVDGRAAVLAINTNRNHGVGARAESGTLPTAGYQGYSESRVGLKYNYGRIQITGPVMRSMGSDRGSFTRAVQSETTGVVTDLKNDINRQCFNDGTGAIAQCAAGGPSTTVSLTGAGPVAMRQLMVGMVVDIGTAADPDTLVAGTTITAVDRSAETITIGTSITTTTSHYVHRAGSGGSVEIVGLSKQIDDTATLWNIDPTSVDSWVSSVYDSVGAIAEADYIQAQQDVNIATGDEINLWITTPEVHRSTSALLTSLKRFPTTNEMRGGYTGLDMSAVMQGNSGSNTVTLTYDKDCPEGTAFGLCTRRIQNYRMSDWEFMDEDGAVLNRVANTDAYEATLFCYMQPATDSRGSHARLNGIT